MEQLELLWELENHKIELEEIQKEFIIIKTEKRVISLEEKSKSLEIKTNHISDRLIQNNLLLRENNNLLKEYNYNLNKKDEELYNGLITDLRQLDYLSSEKDKLKTMANNLETSILTLMDENEKMELESINIDRDLILISKEIDEFRNSNKGNLTKLENQIIKSENVIKTLEEKIDSSFLNRFNSIRKTRGNSIVAVKNHICSGCNMHIPTYLKNVLKHKSEVIYCESCSRILYYIDEEDN